MWIWSRYNSVHYRHDLDSYIFKESRSLPHMLWGVGIKAKAKRSYWEIMLYWTRVVAVELVKNGQILNIFWRTINSLLHYSRTLDEILTSLPLNYSFATRLKNYELSFLPPSFLFCVATMKGGNLFTLPSLSLSFILLFKINNHKENHLYFLFLLDRAVVFRTK